MTFSRIIRSLRKCTVYKTRIIHAAM